MGERWAIVIGIDKYEDPSLRLRGAVRDALAMTDWLTTTGDAGGGVPRANVLLMLGRGDWSPEAPPDALLDVRKDEIVKQIRRHVAMAGKAPDRLYFFYSGHGFGTRVGGGLESAITAGDFATIQPESSISLSSLFEYFQAQPFPDQFFFIDACRNLVYPPDQVISPGQMTPRPAFDPNRPQVQQFRLHATSPGVRAEEGSDERGAFTSELLRGLAGAGKAKAWDGENKRYLVRLDRLFDFVRASVVARRKVDDKPGFIQVPTRDGQVGSMDGDPNPVLGIFDEKAFPDARIEVSVGPAERAAEAEVSLSREGAHVDAHVETKSETGEVRTFAAPPREYTVRVTTKMNRVEPLRQTVEAYEAPERPSRVAFTITHGIALREQFGQGPGTIEVTCPDDTLTLSICNATGKPLHVGTGRLKDNQLTAGIYRVRVVGPTGDVTEQVIDLEPGAREKVTLAPPAPEAAPEQRSQA